MSIDENARVKSIAVKNIETKMLENSFRLLIFDVFIKVSKSENASRKSILLRMLDKINKKIITPKSTSVSCFRPSILIKIVYEGIITL